MSINGKIRFNLGLEHTGPQDLTTPFERLPSIDYDVTDGTSAEQIDLLWHDQRSVSTGGEEHDLGDGTLIDSFGVACAFAEVRFLVVKQVSGSGSVIVGGAATDEWTGWVGAAGDTVTVPVGGTMSLYTPTNNTYDVSGSSNHLKIASSSGTVTYDIYIGGTSA